MGRATGAIGVLVVDDHRLVAEAVAETLAAQPDVEIRGTAASLREGLTLASACVPDVIVLDARLPDGDGAASAGRFLDRCPQAAVLILTAQPGIDVVARAVTAGAAGCVMKTTPLSELVTAVRRVHAGDVLFDRSTMTAVTSHLQAPDRAPVGLTERELEILQLLADARSTSEMASRLFLSQHTIRNHVRNILAKLGVRSRIEAVTLALRQGLVETDGDGGGS